MSSGMMVLTIFLMTVVILCVYFACNSGGRSTDWDDSGAIGNVSAPDFSTEEEEAPPRFPEDKTDVISVSDDDMTRGDLILVNAWHEHTFGGEGEIVSLYHNEEKSSSYGLATSSISCSHDILSHLNDFIDDYAAATEDDRVILNAGYRTYSEQEEILKDRIESDGEEEAYKYVALPGQSEHHTGLSLDIASGGANYDSMWMPQHCHLYGFVQRYRADKQEITGISSEYWHYRYVGIPHAEIMMAGNLCLEEYIDLLHMYSYEHPFEYSAADGENYVIYYTPCEYDGETEIKVPRGSVYSVSGDNVSGFIVTVTVGEE